MSRVVVTSFFLLIAVLLLVSIEACGKACTNVGCSNGVIARLELPKPLSELTGSRITICQGDDCVVRSLVKPCVDDAALKAGDLRVLCYTELADRAREDVITVSFFVPEAQTSVDGQVFTFFVTDAAGTIIAQRSGPAAYADEFPNGPDCGAACRQARLN